MKRLLCILFLLLPLCSEAQTNDMLVYTVAGSDTAIYQNDGGPATDAHLESTEGVWMDSYGNIYISDQWKTIRKVSANTGIITTIAGNNNSSGFSGDNGPATDATLNVPYGVYATANGDIYFADINNNRVRKVDASSGIITTIAGGGTTLGDGGAATAAQLDAPNEVFLDNSGNIYVGENSRIRKIDAVTGNITTVAGNGSKGLSGDNGPATNAQLWEASGMVMDKIGNLFFADRANGRIRKINAKGVITTVAGTTQGYSGDGGPATNAQIAGPIGLGIDSLDNLIIADNGNNFIRKINMTTGIITTIAGVGNDPIGSSLEGAPATNTQMHPEFLYVDKNAGAIYYSTWGPKVRKIINYDAAKSYGLGLPVIEKQENKIDIYPNPTNNLLQIDNLKTPSTYRLLSIVGAVVQQGALKEGSNSISIAALPGAMYMLEITDNERQRIFTKIVKQ